MPWISFESTSFIVLNIVGGFLAEIALLLIHTGWKFIDKRLNRRMAVRDLREFFQGWGKRRRKMPQTYHSRLLPTNGGFSA